MFGFPLYPGPRNAPGRRSVAIIGGSPALRVAAASLAAGFTLHAQTETSRGAEIGSAGSGGRLNETELQDKAMQVMEAHCISCHGPDKQKGDIRLDSLETIDPVDLQKLLADAKEAVHFEDMPPDDAKTQPSDAERKILLEWLEGHLSGEAAAALAEKLLRFEYGNVVKHAELFSGKNADLPGYTEDRRWLISEFIFNEKVNRLVDYHPTRSIYGERVPVAGDSGVHWSPKTEHGNKFRRTITNPFLLPEVVGVRYSGHEVVTDGHILTMLGNAERIAAHMSSEETMAAEYPVMHSIMKTELEHRRILRSREAFLASYTFMDRLLEDLYGKEHEAMLPGLVRQEIPYPGGFYQADPGQKKRNDNAGFLPRLDPEDVGAIFKSIAAYKAEPFTVTEDKSKAVEGERGQTWAPYLEAERAEYDKVILKAERDWAMAGVSSLRIGDRITLMKQFWDRWDMNMIFREAGKRASAPDYKPLDDAEMSTISAAIRKHRKKGDTYQQIIDKCMAEWRDGFKAEREAIGDPDDETLAALISELHVRIYEREPTGGESEANIALMRSYLAQLETQEAIGKLIESLILKTEFLYRHEFGTGEPDEHGRRMMSPRDASYALAYALTDSSPDEELAKAAAEGRLNTRSDYEREVRRMLARRDRWTIIDEAVQATGLNASVTKQPIRKLRFFREFFGYPKAMTVFKDDVRFGINRNEEIVTRLIDEADMLVEHILERDKDVFTELLTTDEFYVYHSGDNAEMQAGSDALKLQYEYYSRFPDWREWKNEDFAKHHEPFREWVKGKASKDIARRASEDMSMKVMVALEQRFGAGQKNGVPYNTQNRGFWHGGLVLGRTGQQMRGQEVTSYWNIDWKTWNYPTEQPVKIPNRKGMLSHPAWLVAHSMNLESDPIHRGKWVREKLLGGTVPDVPITVDAVIPPDHTKTLRKRMEARTGDVSCWRCHEQMDPLGFPFEMYDDFGRFRIEESIEHPDNVLMAAKDAPDKYGANLVAYITQPVDPRGVLKGTDDPALDGDVKDAFDMIDRLAKADKTRQSIIRHAFRYFMGRNEKLSDSATLIAADKAYLESNGSFDEVIVSLLTSDSFIYRKPSTPSES